MPIPPASTAVHHITDEMVADKPLFKDVARNIAKVFEGADIAGFNSNRFDVPLLIEELLRAGVNLDISKRKFVDVQTIYHIMEPRTLKKPLTNSIVERRWSMPIRLWPIRGRLMRCLRLSSTVIRRR